MSELRHDGVVRAEVDAGVAVVTLNRPDQRNALNRAIQAAIPRVLADLDAAEDVDAIVLTGADPAFCAGVDLKELGSGGTDGDSAALVLPKDRRGPFPAHSTPIIGAVNGVAITGGLEVALACDFLVASDRARFADTHARVGVMPGWGLTVLLPQAVGIRRAREMSITGNFVDTPTALAWGLVNHVVPHDELLPFARQLALDVTGVPRDGVRRMLQTYHETADVTLAEGWAIEGRVSREWLAGGLDAAEVERRRQAIVDRGRTQL
jgi:enoyl-CoA hydratase